MVCTGRASSAWHGSVTLQDSPAWGATPPMAKESGALGHQREDVIAGHQLILLVGDFHVPYDHALRVALGRGAALIDLALAGQAGADGVAGGHRGDEPQGVQAVVGQDRAFAGIDEQAGSGGQHEIAMGDTLAELGLPGGDLIEVHVEVVAGEAAKVHDIGFGDGAAVSQQRLPNLQVVEVTAERMDVALDHCSTADVLASYRSHHAGRALDGRALQVVMHRANTAELFTATGATWAAVLENGER